MNKWTQREIVVAAAIGVVQTALMLLLVIGTRLVFNVGLERALGKGGA